MTDNTMDAALAIHVNEAIAKTDNGGSNGTLDVKVDVQYKGDMNANVSRANIQFLLNGADGTHLCEPVVTHSDEFEVIESGGTSHFNCRLDVQSVKVEPNRDYQLQVNAFGQTQSTEFQFV